MNTEIIEDHISPHIEEYNEIMVEAAGEGDIHMVRMMIKRRANNYSDALIKACEVGSAQSKMDPLYLEIGKIMIERAKQFNLLMNYDVAIEEVIKRGANIKTISLYLNFFFKEHKMIKHFHIAIQNACKYENLKILKMLISIGKEMNYPINLEMLSAFESKNKKIRWKIVKLMLKEGANDYEETMDYAGLYGDLKIVKLMLKKGATNYQSTLLSASSMGHHKIEHLMSRKYLLT